MIMIFLISYLAALWSTFYHFGGDRLIANLLILMKRLNLLSYSPPPQESYLFGSPAMDYKCSFENICTTVDVILLQQEETKGTKKTKCFVGTVYF